MFAWLDATLCAPSLKLLCRPSASSSSRSPTSSRAGRAACGKRARKARSERRGGSRWARVAQRAPGAHNVQGSEECSWLAAAGACVRALLHAVVSRAVVLYLGAPKLTCGSTARAQPWQLTGGVPPWRLATCRRQSAKPCACTYQQTAHNTIATYTTPMLQVLPERLHAGTKTCNELVIQCPLGVQEACLHTCWFYFMGRWSKQCRRMYAAFKCSVRKCTSGNAEDTTRARGRNKLRSQGKSCAALW